MKRTAYLSHTDCELHEMQSGHPESPRRLQVIREYLMERGLFDFLWHVEAPLATREQLYRVHRRDYVDAIFEQFPLASRALLGHDVLANQHTLQAALRAAGAVIKAVDLVMTGQAANAFCAVRPPGHHATRDQAMGFCVFSNVAVAAAHALAVHGLERIAIVDFDVHHGNGTEDVLQGDSRVLFCSSYQHPFYPYSVPETSHSNIVHVPLYAGTTGDDFREQILLHWMPRLAHFKPQLILISAGFDAHQADPLADIALDERDYRWVTQEIRRVADQYAQGRIVSSLEGGYELTALARSVYQHIAVLMEDECDS
jgi:acetoin utilization deacetylase AcuC-like enzyme